MILTVDSASPVPPYEQVREQLATMIASGVLAAGTRLPTIRQLAADLDVAPGTITRVYRELESAGDIISRGRHGTYVAQPRHYQRAERRALLNSEAERYARTASQLGVPPAEAIAAIQRALSPRRAPG